jgi:hypothetical protein
MFGLFGKEPDFEIEDVLESMQDAFRENGFKISKKKTGGPVMGDGFKHNYFEVNLGSKFYYTLIYVNINKSNKILEIKTKATYGKDYGFSTCPYFYKLFPKFDDIISVANVKDQTDLWKVCKNYADAVKPTIEYKFKVFKEEVNKMVMEYESKDGKNRGVTCMFDTKDKRDVLFEEGIFDEDAKEQLYNLTNDEYFLPQEVKDMFIF